MLLLLSSKTEMTVDAKLQIVPTYAYYPLYSNCANLINDKKCEFEVAEFSTKLWKHEMKY